MGKILWYMYLAVVLVLNFWLFQVVKFNVFAGLLLIASTIAIDLWLKHKIDRRLPLLLFASLLFLQFQTTTRESLDSLNLESQLLVQMRLREYPMAHLFESRPELLVFFKIQENLAQTLDPNFYFFANHPRERAGIQEFEKFPYILLPVLLIGIVYTIQRKAQKQLLFIAVVPIALLSLIGHKNNLGPLSLFPFLVIATSHGLAFLHKKLYAKF